MAKELGNITELAAGDSTMNSLTSKTGQWRRVKVEDVCEKVGVGIVIQPSQYYVEPGQGVRAFRSANVGINKVVDRDWVYLSQEGHRLNAKSALREGDVLVVRSGALAGNACVVTREYAGSNCIDVVIARPKADELLPEYLAQFTNSAVGQQHVFGNKVGQALSHFNVGSFKTLELYLPPKSEQKTIINLLSDWDNAIERQESLIDAKVKLNKALCSPFLCGKHTKSVEWIRADQLFKPINERGRPDLEILSATQDKGVIPRKMLDKQILMDSSNPMTFKIVRPNDFVISLRSFQGGFEQSTHEGIISPAYTVLRSQSAVVPRYFRHYLKSHDFIQRLSIAVVGIRDGKQINFTDFASVKLPVPPKDEQIRYADLLDALDEELNLLSQQAEQMHVQKRGLLQKLLSGKCHIAVTKESSTRPD